MLFLDYLASSEKWDAIFSGPENPGPRDLNWHTLYMYVHSTCDSNHSTGIQTFPVEWTMEFLRTIDGTFVLAAFVPFHSVRVFFIAGKTIARYVQNGTYQICSDLWPPPMQGKAGYEWVTRKELHRKAGYCYGKMFSKNSIAHSTGPVYIPVKQLESPIYTHSVYVNLCPWILSPRSSGPQIPGP